MSLQFIKRFFNMDSKQKFEHRQEDYLLMMYQKGMHYVFERIFFHLELETIQSCQKISSQWRQIFKFYLGSNLVRIRKFISRWLDMETKVS